MDSATLTIDVLALALSAASVTAVLTVTYFLVEQSLISLP
jgi:hypothetical protein